MSRFHRKNLKLCASPNAGATRILAVVTMVFVLVSTAAFAQGQLSDFIATDGSVTAKGKWKSISSQKGDDLSNKHTMVEISCFKQTEICVEAQAQLVGSEPDVNVFYYDVVRWDNNGIIAEENRSICMTNQLNINFQAQSVIVIDAPKKGATGFKGACKLIDHTETYKLVDHF